MIFDSLLDPGSRIPQDIIDLNGIDNEMVKGKQDWIKLISKLVPQIVSKDLTIIAHNTDFERRFFEYAIKQSDLDNEIMGEIKWGDSAALYMDKFKEKFPKGKRSEGWNLHDACIHLGISFEKSKAHRAKYDVERTIDLLAALKPPHDTIEPIYREFTAKNSKILMKLGQPIEEQLKKRAAKFVVKPIEKSINIEVEGWTLDVINKKISQYFKGEKSIALGEKLIVECRNLKQTKDLPKWVKMFAGATSTGRIIKFKRP